MGDCQIGTAVLCAQHLRLFSGSFGHFLWLFLDRLLALFLMTSVSCELLLLLLLSRRWRQRERLNAMALSICLFVCLSGCLSVSPSVAKMQNTIFSKTKQFRAMVFIDDIQEVIHGLFKEAIIVPQKSKMAEIRHLENRHDFNFFVLRVVQFG